MYHGPTGADTGFEGGGVPRNFVDHNMWRKAPLETPKASQGRYGGGASGPLSLGGVWEIFKIKCSWSDSEGTWADLRHIRNIFKGHFCKDHFYYSVHSVWGKVQWNLSAFRSLSYQNTHLEFKRYNFINIGQLQKKYSTICMSHTTYDSIYNRSNLE